MRVTYRLFILSYSGKTKLYWNRILQAWMENKNQASPFSADEIESRINFPFSVQVEKTEEN